MEPKNIRFLIKVTMLAWLLVAGGISYFSFHLNHLETALHQLDHKVDKVRAILSFNRPYLSAHSAQLLENYVEIEDIVTSIDGESDHYFLITDVKQLLYTTSEFLDSLFKFLDIHLNTTYFAHQNRLFQQNPHASTQLKQYYYQVEALVFQSMNSGALQNPGVYRGLDTIYRQSTLLPEPEREALQQDLVFASSLIESYASRAHVADELIDDSVFDEISRLSDRIHYVQDRLFTGLLVVSFLAMALSGGWMVFLSYMTPAAAPDSPTSSDNEETKLSDSPRADSATQPNAKQAESVTLPSTATVNQGPSAMAEASVYDAEYFLASLNGDMEAVRMLLNVFISDHRDDVRKFKAVLPDSIADAEKIMHSLKGVSGSIGATRLHEITTDIDSILKGGQAPTQDSIDLLEAQMNSVLSAIQAFLRKSAQ